MNMQRKNLQQSGSETYKVEEQNLKQKFTVFFETAKNDYIEELKKLRLSDDEINALIEKVRLKTESEISNEFKKELRALLLARKIEENKKLPSTEEQKFEKNLAAKKE
jgi:DNA-binding transcriptional regulator YhcF (GntR family)